MRVKLVIINIVVFIASLYGVFYFEYIGDHWAAKATSMLCVVLLICSFIAIAISAGIWINKKD
jgi:hypothetical protein